MQSSTTLWKRVGIGLAIALLIAIGVRAWVIPAVIIGQIQAQVSGKVTIRDWWIDDRSAGVVGLVLHEGPASRSPVFARIDRVSTDLTLGSLLRGRVSPGRVELAHPRVVLRLDRNGRPINLPTLRAKGGRGSAVPGLSAEDAEVTLRSEGRPDDMVVSRVKASLGPARSGQELSVSADDPTWGHWEAHGNIDFGKEQGSVLFVGNRVQADPERLARVPFIPVDVWSHVAPRGPVDVEGTLRWDRGASPALRTRADVVLHRTAARFPTLGLVAEGTTGRLRVEDGVVRVEQVQARAIGGKVAADGTLDFTQAPPRVDVRLALDQVNVVDTPKSWQLDEAGITGLLTGKARVRAVLDPAGADLSGSSGEAVVEGGSIQGIPVKSLKLAMRAQGNDLQYDAKPHGEARRSGVLRGLSMRDPRVPSPGWRWPGFWAVKGLVALQAPPGPGQAADAPKGGLRLPKSITTQIELEDVDVARLIARAQTMLGTPFPVPITGKLTLKADATIPLGSLRDVRRYAFHGDLTLTGASIYRVDFGRLKARLDLADGVFELKDLRGFLVDRPNGGPDNPPPATPPVVPAEGALPPGGFRGDLRAEVAPRGRLSARFEANQVPLGELAAPALPRPTPLSGLATLELEARADLSSAHDPSAWTASGRVESEHITYRGAALDSVAVRFDLKGGHLDVPSFAARLEGRPLTARVGLDLAPPRAFAGTLDVAGWDLAAVEALIPGAPHPAPVAGTLRAHAEARGTLAPFAIDTRGEGQVGRFQVGPVPLGDVPFRWSTDGQAVALSGIEARPFGGRLSAEARVPLVAGGTVEGSAGFAGIDTAQITAAIPGQGLKLTGRAGGKVRFSIPAKARSLDASLELSAPDLTVQGVPAERVQASLRAQRGTLRYEVTAESLGGKVKFLGDFPLGAASAGPGPRAGTGPDAAANGEIRIVGFTLEDALRAAGVSGPPTRLGGLGAIDANIRDVLSGRGKGVWAHGIVELRDLTLGERRYPLGHLRGVVVKAPTAWRIEPLSGELLGGPASGLLWGTVASAEARRLGFNLRIDRFDLKKLLAFLPAEARNVEGVAMIRLSGDLGEALRADADLRVPAARAAGIPLSEVHVPADLTLNPSSGTGLLSVRHLTARLAGGQARGEASFRLGVDRAFQAAVQLAGLDLQTLTRLGSDTSHPSSGRISGKISLAGPDPAQLQRYRGKVALDLDDASLFALPVFREIDRFLGASGGGLFEDGDLVATIANRQLIVEMLTLEGRLVQLHATGTVGFDTQLNLEVLVNTNQIIPETGQALVGLIPGLRDAGGRGSQGRLQVANYLSNRLLKLRVTGTLRNPSVTTDSSIPVAGASVSFFVGVLKLPIGFVK